MSATGSGYDYSASILSPDGRVFQVEYAMKAVEKSGTAIGIRCKDGVVLGSEKALTSKMLVPGSNKRIQTVDLHSGIAMAGLAADARQLVNKARSESESYQSFYGAEIPGRVLAERLAGHMHMYTLYWHMRPFGCSVLIASYDDTTLGPQLYSIDPSGTNFRYYAAAVGKAKQAAKTELEKIDFQKISCREAAVEIAKLIYKLHDDVKDKAFELELTWVCDESKRLHVPVPKDLLDKAVKIALEAKQLAERGDDDKQMSTKEDKPKEAGKDSKTKQ